MAASGIARRYGEAVFLLAQENNSHEAWLRDIAVLAEAAQDAESGQFFTNPSIPDEVKERAFSTLLPEDGQRQARNLARLLISRNRFEMLPDILEVVTDLVYESQGIVIATVTTAVELTDDERDRVGRALDQLVGSMVEMRTTVDPSIIGGIVARVGDRKIDGSVETQLRNLRGALAQ
jgi:F-type H+-transporting ATPase subunit delta